MTIERQHGYGFIVACDFCSETEELDADSFEDAVAEIRRDGWNSVKNGNEWYNQCPDCVTRAATVKPEDYF